MCEVIAIGNQKGGAGKTTTTKNLAHSLSKLGKRVLAIDFDPQFSLSTAIGFDSTDDFITIADLMNLNIEGKSLPPKVDYMVHKKGVDYILSNITLSVTEMNLVGLFEREYILQTVLEKIKKDYDYILIDCNPSLGMLVINALAAADSVIIPVDSNYLASKGLELFFGTIFRMKKRINPKLEIQGILLTKFMGYTNLAKRTLTRLMEAYGDEVTIFETKIPNTVKVGESDEQGVSVMDLDPNNIVGRSYNGLANEVIINVGT